MITDLAKNEGLNGIIVNTIKLHSGAPGAAATDNEIAGASSAITLAAAAGGVREMENALDIDVPPTTVSHYSLWGGGNLKSTGSFSTPETYAAPGTAKITTATLTAT